MRRFTILSLTVLLTITGCSAIPFGEPTAQKEPAPVVLVNNATLTETFKLAVIDEGANMTVHRSEGQIFNFTIGQGSSTTKTTTDNKMTEIEFPDSARIHGRYTLEPGERKELSIENVAPNEAIVITIYDEPEGTYRAIKSLSCGGPVLGYRVTTQAEGEDETESTHQCGY